jgi:hypothetical protein
MTPQQAMDQAIREAQSRFTYIPDPPKLDVWDTVKEFVARVGGDCDGWVLWCLWRAQQLTGLQGCWWFVEGLVQPYNPETDGHAWAMIDQRAFHVTELLWADPTWGNPCVDPGWFTGRRPLKKYRVDNELMLDPTDYTTP